MRFLLLALLLCAAKAEPPRRPEVFLNYGVLKWAGDEGWLGSTDGWGGTAVVPLTNRLAVELDLFTAFREREGDFGPIRTRRTLISPHLLYRFGSPRVYGYAGAGLGAQIESSTGRFRVGPSEVRDVDETDKGRMLTFAAGLVANPAKSLLLRVGFSAGHRYVLPNTTIKIGVGYRF